MLSLWYGFTLVPNFLQKRSIQYRLQEVSMILRIFSFGNIWSVLRSWRHYDCFRRWREKKPGLDFCTSLYNKGRWNVSFQPSMWLLDPGDRSWQKNYFIHNNQMKPSLMPNLQTIQYIISIFIFIKFYSVINCKMFPSYFFS